MLSWSPMCELTEGKEVSVIVDKLIAFKSMDLEYVETYKVPMLALHFIYLGVLVVLLFLHLCVYGFCKAVDYHRGKLLL